jgi:hypothetical protein
MVELRSTKMLFKFQVPESKSDARGRELVPNLRIPMKVDRRVFLLTCSENFRKGFFWGGMTAKSICIITLSE